MTKTSPEEVSLLLNAWCGGDEEAFEKLMPLVYDELHRRAHRQMAREHPDHTLQTTALVHEAWLRLVDVGNVQWQNRAHFFALCARLMRRILVDHARSRGRKKRGGEALKVSLDDACVVPTKPESALVEIDDALVALAGADARKAKVVELRFFGGLSVEETAEVLGISVSTVMNDLRVAKVWLLRELDHRGGNDGLRKPSQD